MLLPVSAAFQENECLVPSGALSTQGIEHKQPDFLGNLRSLELRVGEEHFYVYRALY